MKKILLLCLMCLGVTALMAQNQFEQRAKNKAEAAARECMREQGLPSNLNIHSAASVNTICDYMNPNPQYFGYEVEVWATPNCPPNQICIQIVYPLAKVTVDCSGQIVNVECYVTSI